LRGNTYYARITVEDPNGVKQERRLALDASTLSEAKDALARLRAEPTEQKRRKKSVPLFPEFWPAYIEAVRHQKRERTIKTEEVFLRQWEAWLGAIPINRVSTAQVLGFRTERLSRGLSGRTANLAVTVLNNLLYYAQALELIKSLPTEEMKPIRWKPKKRPLFTVDDINRLCTDAIGGGRNGQMLSDYLRLMAC
jgi:site-specific recombinase XerD